MSQHDYDIANQTAPNFRSDLNDVLGAIATNNSGATEPSVTYANQWWYDASNDILKIRSEADDAWINVGYLDQSTNEFKPYVGGTQVDTQSTATWEAGTSTTEGIVSPAKVKAAIDARKYKSAEQSISSGGLLTLGHGLGTEPDSISVIAVCKNAQAGFSVGDKIELSSSVYRATGGAVSSGVSVYFDSSNVYLRVGSSATLAYIPNKTTGSSDSISASNFNLVVVAWT